MAAKKKKIPKPPKKTSKPPPKSASPKVKAPAKKVVAKAKPQPAAKKTAAPATTPTPVPAAKPQVKKVRVEVPPPATVEAAPNAPAAMEEEAEEVVLTDGDGRRYCRVKDCDQIAVVDSYCRYHYLLFWKKIQVRKKILSEGKLERYIEELTARYPDKFLDMLRKDLRSEKEFLAAIQELEIDESATENEFEDEAQTYIDEVRGISESTPTREEEEF